MVLPILGTAKKRELIARCHLSPETGRDNGIYAYPTYPADSSRVSCSESNPDWFVESAPNSQIERLFDFEVNESRSTLLLKRFSKFVKLKNYHC